MRVFDMHCDTLTRCKRHGWPLDGGQNQLHLSDAEGFDSYIQLYAVFIPDTIRGKDAARYFSAHHAFYRRQIEEAGGRLAGIDSADGLRQAGARRGMSAILAVENGSVLGGEIDRVRELANAGVRSVTLTWNAENEIAGGVESDGRLTPFGRAAIAEMERLGIAVDVSHLNDGSLYDVLAAARVPVIATHSNARAVCGHRRNLTDEAFTEIARRGGVVGLNYVRNFITDGAPADFNALARHVEHFLSLGGEDAIAIGSDYDGADIPACIDAPGKQKDLCQALLDAGVTQAQADKLFFGNAYRYFSRLYSGALQGGTPG